MSCGCLNKMLSQELDRIRKLAKGLARMEDTTVVIYRNPDGSYGFTSFIDETDNPIVEYITQY